MTFSTVFFHPKKILIAAVVLSVSLKVVTVLNKTTYTHDEAISMLAATGHQQEYARIEQESARQATWSQAEEWKRLMQPEASLCFGEISRGLAATDIHPPMYFWLLHLVILVIGANLWTGVALNIVISLGTIFVLHRLASHLIDDARFASLAVLLWSVSPAVVMASSEARHYDLYTLIAVSFCYIFFLIGSEPDTRVFRRSALLGLIAFIGLFTHYQFALILLASIVAVFLFDGMRSSHAKRIVAAAIAAVVVFLAARPEIVDALTRQQFQKQSWEWTRVGWRFVKALGAPLDFFMPTLAFKVLALVVLVAIVLLALQRKGIDFTSLKGEVRSHAVRRLFFIPMICFAAIFVQYVSFLTPEHAMGGRYLSVLFPFVALALTILIRRFRDGEYLAATLALLMIAGSAVASFLLHARTENQRELAHRAQGYDVIVIDNAARGVALPVVRLLPDNTTICVAMQAGILNDLENVKAGLHGKALMVTNWSYGNSAAQYLEAYLLLRQQQRVDAIVFTE